MRLQCCWRKNKARKIVGKERLQRAVRRHALAEDMQVREALAVLTTPGRYDEILRPPASVVADVRLPPADGRPSGA